MPTDRVPLVGSFNQRGLAGNAELVANVDQRFLNCSFEVIQNPVTEKATLYVQRRPGWSVDSLVSAGNASTGMIRPQSFNATITAFGNTNSDIFYGTTNVGTITGRALFFTETIVSAVTYVMIKSSDGTGWFYANGAKDQTSYTGDTHTNTTIDGIASTAGMYIGQKISGAGIVAGTRILTVNSANAITTDTATIASATITITKEPIAKIIDSDFVTAGTYVSRFAEMDGYLFYTTSTAASIWNSDLNSVTSYSATGFTSPNMSPDPPVAIERSGNAVIVLGAASKEVFYNAGLATGSPLQRSAQYFERIGTLDQRSVTTLENDVYFVSSPHEGDLGVFRITGLNSTRISIPAVDRIIGTAAVNGSIYATSFRLGGYPYAAFIVSLASDGPSSDLLLETGDMLTLESALTDLILLEDTPGQVASFVRMLVYNAFLKVWSEWDCSQATFIDGAAASTANQLLATSRFQTGGYVYTINPAANGDVWQDAGTTYTTEIRTARIDHGTAKRKFIQGIRLVSDQQTAGTVSLYFSDDNYVTWNGPFTFDLQHARPQIQRLGSYRGGRAYKLVHAYNGPFRAESLEIDYVVEE